MAGLGGKNWTFEEEVTSSDVNGFLADQVVMRFADATARTAGFGGAGEPTLAEGMVSYLNDTNKMYVYDGSTWSPVSQVPQVVTANKGSTQSLASLTFTDVTDLSLSITPSSASSKVYVISQVSFGSPTGSAVSFRLMRDSTAIAIGDQEGSNRYRSSWTGYTGYGQSGIISYLDSPATTSATTYKIQFRCSDSGQTVYVNTDGDAGDRYVPSTSMPNVISPALTEVETRGALSAAGMYGAINFYCVEGSAGSDTGNGIAIGQSPEPGEVVKVDTGVEVAMQCAAGAAPDPDTALE